MNFAELENLWRSPQNRPTPADLEKQKMHFIADLRRRHRGEMIFIALVTVLLVAMTWLLVSHLIAPAPDTEPVDLRREWGVIPFFALPWIAWSWFLLRFRAHRRRHPATAASSLAAIAALHDESRLQCARYRIGAWLFAASALLMPLIVHQLRAVGKAGDEILIPALVIYPLYVLGVLLWGRHHYRHKLLPRQRELEEMLSSYR